MKFLDMDKSPVGDVLSRRVMLTFLLLSVSAAVTSPIVQAHDLTDSNDITHAAGHDDELIEGTIYSGTGQPRSTNENLGLTLDDDFVADVVPPFSGTVFLDPDIITPDDPTTFIRLDSTSVSAEVDQYRYTATFSDTDTVKLSALGFSNETLAENVALEVSIALGRVPTSFKKGIKLIDLHQGDGRASATVSQGKITLHTGSSSFKNYLEELLAHEAAHISLDNLYRGNSDWQYAQLVDPTFISTYAQSRSGTEDIAESVVPYLAYRYRPDRISSENYLKILRTMPARIAFFDRELGNPEPVLNDSDQLVSRFTNINDGDMLHAGDFLEWNIPDGADSFDVILGSAGYGSNDIRPTGTLGENRLQISTLPEGIDNIYAQLWSRVDGQWRLVYYRFKTTNSTRTRASIYSPMPGEKIAGDTLVVRWYNPPGTTQVDVLAGTQGPGSTNIRQSQPITVLSSLTLDNVPLEPSIVYVRLRTFNGSWQFEDYEFEANQLAQLLSPVDQTQLSGSNVEFIWDTPPGVTYIDILAGTTGPGTTDIRASSVVPAAQGRFLLESLPTTGQTLYIRFWSLAIDGWKRQDIQLMLPFPEDERDGDGIGDNTDSFPTDTTEITDSEGIDDNADEPPTNAVEITDSDGDGIGDNTDSFPTDTTEITDSEGIGDKADESPADATPEVLVGAMGVTGFVLMIVATFRRRMNVGNVNPSVA